MKLGKGLQILENVVIHPGSKIGNYCIVLSNSLIDHDCILGKCVELAGGVNLAGRIHIGDYSWLGIGSTVFADQNSEDPRKIGNNCIIGASSLVNKDIPNNYVAYGIPAKKKSGKMKNKKNILILGGGGYLGQSLAELFSKKKISE